MYHPTMLQPMKGLVSDACRLCDGQSTDDLGEIVHVEPLMVAGVEVDGPLETGHIRPRLRRCRRCGFQFKHPPLAVEALMRCYNLASASRWEESPDPVRRRFDVISAVLARFASGGPAAPRRILDVGCFNGALLDHLGGGWERCGIEPSKDAASLAQRRGIDMIAPTLDAVSSDIAPFDAITMIDLVEHLTEPMPLFRSAAVMLRRDGILVVGTGDSDAWPWRMQRGRYWYCSLPEHVSFFGAEAMRFIAAETGLEVVHTMRLSHIRAPFFRWLRDAARNLAYEVTWRTGLTRRAAPGWVSANDHMLVVMRRR